MEKIAELHRKVAPETVSVMEDRYNILRHIQVAQPVGRRSLATALDMSERVVRAQVDFLKSVGLIDFSPLGMTITGEGNTIISDMADYVRALHGLDVIEKELAKKLGFKRVVIIRGDSEQDSSVKRELGRAAASVLAQYVGDNMTIAVSGGSTMAEVAECIMISAPATTVVPARGGLGERVEYQANTIAAAMATKLGGRYRLLHIPDGVDEAALEVIIASDANVRSVAKMIKKADILLSGIGQAVAMAVRRGFEPLAVEELKKQGAVGETLGQYCTLKGEVVYSTSSVGLHLKDLVNVGHVIAVAGGREKAEAIVSVAAAGGQDVLITDEAAARAIRDIIVNSE